LWFFKNMFFLQNPGSGSSTPGSTPTAAAAAAAASAWRWISPPTGGGGGAAGSCQQQQTAGSQYSQQQAAAVAAVNQALSYAQVHQDQVLLVFPFVRTIGRVTQKRPNKNVCSGIKCGVAGGKSVRLRTSSTFSLKEPRRLACFVVLCFFMYIYPIDSVFWNKILFVIAKYSSKGLGHQWMELT
jgi:hypothetical protein